MSFCATRAFLQSAQRLLEKSAAQSGRSCSTHQDCKRAGTSRDGQREDVCLSATHACVALQSPDCTRVQGPAYDERHLLTRSAGANKSARALK